MSEKGKKESFVVVGAGRAGTAMAKVIKDAGYDCLGLFGRTPEKIERSAALVGAAGHTRPEPDIIRRARLLLIGVPDDVTRRTALELAAMGAIGEEAVLMHLSGLVTSEVFIDPAIRAGGRVSAHPNLAFADPATAAGKVRGTYFGIEGDSRGLELAERIVRDVGGVPVEIPASGKTAYHLAAVFASNGMVVLASMAAGILKDLGVSTADAEKITSRLMLGTAQNLDELGVLGALTGPVVRGDAKTVSSHLEVMEAMEADHKETYRLLFRRMVRLGIDAGRGTEEKYRPIIEALGG